MTVDFRRPAGLALLVCAALPAAGAPRIAARLENQAVRESSGVAASRRHAGVYWTHNDSGGKPEIFAFDASGRDLGRWTVDGAKAVDWEDIASGPGPEPNRSYLYVGDTGDNTRRRSEITVYRIEEPDAKAGCADPCLTAPADVFRLRYPDGSHDAETLLVHPTTGDLYIVTKANGRDPDTIVFRAPAAELGKGLVTLAEVAVIAVQDPLFARLAGGLTGGDISSDGRRVALSDYFHIYEAVLPAGRDFDRIWDGTFRRIPLGAGMQVEGVAYRNDGEGLLATAEGSPCPVILVDAPR